MSQLFQWISLLIVFVSACLVLGESDENSHDYWKNLAKEDIARRVSQVPNVNKARNIIFFLGDGMSISTVTAARILKGQLAGNTGEEAQLEFEKFPYLSHSKTYDLNTQTPDSASTATAFLCGSKANSGTIGMTGNVKLGDCQAGGQEDNHVTSIVQWAQDAGMSTGVVTTTRITHATPAGAYAHVAHRDWEAYSPDGDLCPDIAYQMVHGKTGSNINVLMGGGMDVLTPVKRKDNRDLTSDWLKQKQESGKTARFVINKEQMDGVDPNTEFVLGIFNKNHLNYTLDRIENRKDGEPSLTDMVAKSVAILSKNPKGYFLLVEGGRIDHGHHDAKAKRALYETLEMDRAVGEAYRLTDPQDTLIIVSSDHSHTMTISGYPARGTDILGFAGTSGTDNLPYTSLSYANGPNYANRKQALTLEEVTSDDYVQASAVPMDDETHAADDVAVFATGPWAHLFSGVHEQSNIAHTLAYAGCLLGDEGALVGDHCQKGLLDRMRDYWR